MIHVVVECLRLVYYCSDEECDLKMKPTLQYFELVQAPSQRTLCLWELFVILLCQLHKHCGVDIRVPQLPRTEFFTHGIKNICIFNFLL